MTTTYKTEYRTKYNAQGQPEGKYPVRVYPVGSSNALSDKLQAVIALAMLVVACALAWGIIAFGTTIKAVLF